MFEMKRVLNHLLIVASLLLASCGYVSDKPVQNADVYRANELQSCKIDVTKLSEIFKADQKQQIKCLQDNFIQFTKYVRSKNPGSVNENELGIFIKKFFEGQSDSIIKGLSIIFQLNMILLKDEADRISNNNITPLFELLIQINKEAVIITDILKQMDDEQNQGKFWELRENFYQSVARFSAKAIELIDKSPGLAKKLNIREFVLEATKKVGSAPVDEQTIDSFMFLKRVLLAGDSQVITTDELKEIIGKLPNLLSLVFDVYYVTNKNFQTDSEQLKFYLQSTRELYEILQFNQPDFTLITTEQLIVIIEKFYKDKDVRKFKSTLEIYKQKFIGGKPDTITLKDMRVALDIAHDLLERLYFNNVTYESAKPTMDKIEAIKYFDRLKLKEYEIFSERRLNELHQSFADIAVNFRYFRNKETGANYYGTQIKRNLYGFHELAISKWLAQKLILAYGHKDTNGVIQVSMDEFSKFLLDSKPLLEEFKLWSPNFESFSRNSVLLGDLFQQQSNGDLNIGVNEATEYISMILSAVEISGKINDNLTASCTFGSDKEDPKFDKKCFNDHFFDILLNKLEYRKFMPRLSMYVNDQATPKTDIEEFLKGVEGFARDDDKPGVPVNRRDSTLILGALLNIESTFIRFDANNDNIIDYVELKEAFKTYRNSIIILAKLAPADESYAFSIFLYMVSKMQVPPQTGWLDDMAFLYWHGKVKLETSAIKGIVAKRMNIGKLLSFLVNQNTTTTTPKNKKLKLFSND